MKTRFAFLTLLTFVITACSPSTEDAENPAAVESEDPKPNPQPQPKEKKLTATPSRSFDPSLLPSTLERKITSQPKPEKSAEGKSPGEGDPEKEKPVPAFVVEGREAEVAASILELPEGDAQSLALTELVSRWAENDLEAAWAFRESLGDDIHLKRAFHRGIMPVLAEKDPEVVLDTIEQGVWWQDQWIPAKKAALKVSQYDLDRAVNYFANTQVGKQQKELAYIFAKRLARERSHEESLAFAEEIESPVAKAYATRAGVNKWVEEDAFAASGHVDQIEDPLVRSHAILGLIDGIWQTNPQDSVTWAQSIDDGEIRQTTLGKLAVTWQRRGESENVNAVLNAPGLSGADRQSVNEALAAAAESNP